MNYGHTQILGTVVLLNIFPIRNNLCQTLQTPLSLLTFFLSLKVVLLVIQAH